jgi:ferric-dicitrate binding protein FerR (iron transport regulator)
VKTPPFAHSERDVLGQAIDWAIRLQSGLATENDRAACDSWRAAQPAHEQAWQKVQSVEAAFQNMPDTTDEVAFATLQGADRRAVRSGRRRALKLAGLGVVALAGGFSAYATLGWQQRTAYATAIGERRRVLLPDGTTLNLNTDSEVEVAYSFLRRLVVLKQGEIFVETGKDADSLSGRRPFWIHAAQARLEAIGTQFGVRDGDHSTRVHVTEGLVAVHPLSGASVMVRAGDVIEVGEGHSVPVRISDTAFDPSAWSRGSLIARRMRLADFLEELRRYRRSPLSWEAAVAELRISGVFQLEGPDPTARALEIVAATLDLKTEPDTATGGILVRVGGRI